MKMYVALALASTLSFAAADIAGAEPFNERGEYFIANVKISPHFKRRQPVTIEWGAFTQRGEDYIAISRVGSRTRYVPVMAKPESFNERGEDFFISVRAGSHGPVSSTGRSFVGSNR